LAVFKTYRVFLLLFFVLQDDKVKHLKVPTSEIHVVGIVTALRAVRVMTVIMYYLCGASI